MRFALKDGMRRILKSFLVLVFMTALFSEGRTALYLDQYETQITRAEKAHGIPHGLLLAIAKIESGQYNAKIKKRVVCPWAVNAEGTGTYYASKADALKAVKALRKQGKTNFDVGLMQVNWHHHGENLPSLEQAFDPHVNITYAARFLKNLKESLGSWEKAVSHYHSAHPEFHIPYRRKVLNAWQEIRRDLLVLEKEPRQEARLIRFNHANPWVSARTLLTSRTQVKPPLKIVSGTRQKATSPLRKSPLILTGGERLSSSATGAKLLVLKAREKLSSQRAVAPS